MSKINFKEVESIDINFENCEWIQLPIGCFENLEIECSDLVNYKGEIKSLKCNIIDRFGIKDGYLTNVLQSPIQRINQYNDIVRIHLKYKNGEEIVLVTPWHDDWNYTNNNNQHSKLISYKEIELYIAENSKEYTLSEALEELNDGDIIIDSKGNEYEICVLEETGEKYLNSFIKQSILNEIFTKKV